MTVAKKYVIDIVERMPDELDIDDLMYELYVIEKVMRGMKDIDSGNVVAHEEAKRRLLKR